MTHVTADANRGTLLHESYFGGNTLVQLLTNQIKIHGGGGVSQSMKLGIEVIIEK